MTDEDRKTGGASVARAVFLGWSAVILVVVSTLMGAHLYALPEPSPSDLTLRESLAALRPLGDQSWQMTHVLYSECRCSRNVFSHVLERPRTEGVIENMLLVGARRGMAERAEAQGFHVVTVSRSELLSRFHIEAVPLLVIADPSGAIRYAGGYTERKQGLEIEDEAILASLRSGDEPTVLPLFGCATSRALSSALDPFGLRTPADDLDAPSAR